MARRRKGRTSGRPRRRPAAQAAPDAGPGLDRLDLLLAAGAALTCGLVYLLTLAPTVTLEDSGEMIAGAASLGILHPPGYPLWTLLAHAFTWLPFGTVAWRVNLSSACFAAAAVGVLYLTVRVALRARAAGLVAALAAGLSRTIWSQAVVAEVYALHLLLTLVALFCMCGWQRTRRRGWILAACLAVGLGLANHQTIGILLPVLGVWVLAVEPRTARDPRLLAASGLLLAAPLCLYLYLPIRSAMDPPIDFGNPELDFRAPEGVLGLPGAVLGAFGPVVDHVLRRSYSAAERGFSALVDPFRFTGDFAASLGDELTWALVALALLGVPAALRRAPQLSKAALAVIVLNVPVLHVVTAVPFTPLYAWVSRVFHLPALAMIACFAGAGAAAALAWLEQRSGRLPVPRPALLGAGGLLLAALVGNLVVSNYAVNDQSRNRLARDLGLNILRTMPERAVFFPMGDAEHFTVAYLKVVEGLAPGVRVVSPGQPVLMERPALDSDAHRELLRMPRFASQYGIAPHLTDPWAWHLLAREEAVPHGILYRAVAAGRGFDPEVAGYRDFPVMDYRLPEPPTPSQREDRFAREIYGAYALYAARLGARFHAEGRDEEAKQWFDREEQYSTDDPASCFLRAQIHLRLGLRTDRAIRLLEQARAAYRRDHDPRVYPVYPVDLERIEVLLVRAREAHGRPEGGP